MATYYTIKKAFIKQLIYKYSFVKKNYLQHMKKIFLLGCCSLLLWSCSSTKKITGFYSRCVGTGYTCTQLQINPNYTFEYYSENNGYDKTIIKGTWKKFAQKQILLNSDSQPKNAATKYYARANPNFKSFIRIQLIENSRFLDSATVIINKDQQIKKTDTHGIVEFAATKVTTIEYRYKNMTETFTITNADFNDFQFMVKDYETIIFPKYFTNKLVSKNMRKVIFERDNVSEKFDLKKTAKSEKRF